MTGNVVVDSDRPLEPDGGAPTGGTRRPGRFGRLAGGLGRPGPHAYGVGAVTVVFGALYSLYSLLRHFHYQSGLFDLGIFDQVVRGYAHFHAPRTTIIHLDGPHDPGTLQLADHFSPLLAALAPLYWIHDDPTTLLVAQAALFALAIPPLWLFARRRLGTAPAYLVAVGFGLSWPLQAAVGYDVHEVALAVPVTAWALERATAGRHRQAAAISLLLLLVKEDMGLVVAALGLLLASWGSRRLGTALTAAGLAAVGVTTRVLIPAFGGSADRDWTYGHLGANPVQALWHLVAHPADSLHYGATPGTKWVTLLWLFAPLLFLPLLSPITLLAVPLLLERMLSGNSSYWGTSFHYNAYLVAILFFAAVDGAARVRGRLPDRARRPAPAVAMAAVAVVAAAVLPHWPLWKLTDTAWWETGSSGHTTSVALSHVPPGVSVGVDRYLGTHLTARNRQVTEFPDTHHRYPGVKPDWVLTEEGPDARRLLTQGYRVAWSGSPFVVLRRT
ncbi:MAG: DUF2079 domain-containing protein [Mycobacteriales bacterium]